MSTRSGLRTFTPRFLLSDAELSVTMFNERSLWTSEVYRFDQNIPGGGARSLNWRLGCADKRWHSSRWQKLLGDARRFLCSVQDENLSGKNPAEDTLLGVGSRVRFMMHWMFSEGYSAFSEFDPDAFSGYKDYTLSMLHDDETSKRTLETVASYLAIPQRLFRQSPLFEDFPRLVLLVDPLQGRSAQSICKQLNMKEKGRVLPVPDAVATPTLTTSFAWIDDHSDNIIEAVRLQDYFYRKAQSWKSKNYAYYINDGISGFKFHIRGQSTEWRAPLLPSLPVRVTTEEGERVVQQTPLQQLSELFDSLVGACTTMMHATTGFRSSEGASLLALPQSADGMPYCIEVRPSLEGLNELHPGKTKEGPT